LLRWTEYIYILLLYFILTLACTACKYRTECIALQKPKVHVVYTSCTLNMWDGKQHVMSSPAKLGMLHSTVVIFFISGPGRLLNLSFYWM